MAISLVRSARPGDLVALHVHDDQVVGMHHAFAHARGRGQDALGIQADADVAVVGGHPALLEDQAADLANVLAVLALRLHHAGSSIVAERAQADAAR